MKKIAIISEFNRTNTNYGNRLQAFALYHYLQTKYSEVKIEYLYFDFYDKMKITKKNTIFEEFNRILKGLCHRILPTQKPYKRLTQRRIACDAFSTKNMSLAKNAYSWNDLEKSDFDAFIVGSDVVWAQGKNKFARMRFLDFETLRPFIRISYAASFGRDWIPEENKEHVKRCLKKFQAVSVREKSSVELLESLGISAEHTLDPTLLLNAEEWEKYEEPLACLSDENEQKKEFIFTYFLGNDSRMRNAIAKWASEKGFLIVTIPYAAGKKNFVDKHYGDIQLFDCSPENWLWLIHNSRYVITDSFHGSVFSTIFEKEFLVLERKSKIDINNRMIDFLTTINQTDKMISYHELDKVDNLEWDYRIIKQILDEKLDFSEEYLRKAVEGINKNI